MKPQSSHYLVLDGARGLAAIAVMLYHLNPYFFDLPGLQGSFLAVDLFFVMSGFVVARAYEPRLHDGSMGFWQFTRVRLIRLYPLYLAACVIGLSYQLLKMGMAVPDAYAAQDLLYVLPQTLLVLPNTAPATGHMGLFPFAPSAWSLSLELWMNLLFALAVVQLRTAWIWALTGLSLVLLIYKATAFSTFDLGMTLPTLFSGVLRFWFSFLLGVLIYRHRLQLGSGHLSVLLLMPLVFLFPAFPREAVWLQAVWVVAVFPLFVATSAQVALPRRIAPVFDHLGRLSYGLYILHTPVFLVCMGVVKVAFGEEWEAHRALIGCAVIAAIFAVTAALTYAFDEPLRQVLRKRRVLATSQ